MPNGREVCVRWILPTLLADRPSKMLCCCATTSTGVTRSSRMSAVRFFSRQSCRQDRDLIFAQ
eukprot:scaffold2879_cov128-Skeletonema_dohrnii-CCMP3373.AAC.2